MVEDAAAYPFCDNVALDVDERYLAAQTRGLVKVQLPFGEPCWLATRYEDVIRVFDHRGFSRAMCLTRETPGVFPSYVNIDPDVLLNMDPPQHSRIKGLAGPFFSPLRIKTLSEFVQSVIDELLDKMEAQGPPCDFVAAYSNILPVRTLARVLGVPDEEAFEFKEYAEASIRIGISDEQRKRNSATLAAFVLRLVADRRARPSNDLLSELVNARDDGNALTERELLRLLESLWLGGFKTTLWQLGSTVFTLMVHRGHWQELLHAPQLLAPALNELWRWIPSFKPASVFPRYAKTEVEFSDGTIVRAGEPVLPEFVIANRDERAFPQASKLDFHREKPRPHLSFGNGAHVCIGQHLAKLQVRLTVESLLRRFPDLRLAVPAADVQWDPTSIMRAVEALPLEW